MNLVGLFESAKDKLDITLATHGLKHVDNLSKRTLAKMSQDEFDRASNATVSDLLDSVPLKERHLAFEVLGEKLSSMKTDYISAKDTVCP